MDSLSTGWEPRRMRSLLAGLWVLLAMTVFADVPCGTNDSAGGSAAVNGIQLYHEIDADAPPRAVIHGSRIRHGASVEVE